MSNKAKKTKSSASRARRPRKLSAKQIAKREQFAEPKAMEPNLEKWLSYKPAYLDEWARASESVAVPEATVSTQEQLPLELIARARDDDRSVLPDLRVILDDHREIADQIGNLANAAQLAWVNCICGSGLYEKELLFRKIRDFKLRVGNRGLFPAETASDRGGGCELAANQLSPDQRSQLT